MTEFGEHFKETDKKFKAVGIKLKPIAPEPYAGPIWRVEGKERDVLCGDGTMVSHDWIPIEEYASQFAAETRLRYWSHIFPFKDLFVWRVSEQTHSQTNK